MNVWYDKNTGIMGKRITNITRIKVVNDAVRLYRNEKLVHVIPLSKLSRIYDSDAKKEA